MTDRHDDVKAEGRSGRKEGIPAIAFGRFFWNKSASNRTNPMKWLFLNPIKAQGWGGMENWMLKLCLGLREHGDQCLMVARPHSPWPDVCRQNGIGFASFRFGVDLAPWALLRLRHIASRFQPDVVMAKGFRQVRFAKLACPGAGIATKMPSAMELTDQWVERGTVTACIDRIFVDSHTAREAFLRHSWVLPGKVAAVHNGVALPDPALRAAMRTRLRAELGLPADALLVGGAGRFSPDKRYADALHAFAESARDTAALLVLLGDGEERKALEALTVKLGLTGRVLLPGWRENAREWLSAFDILLHPSAIEGLPNAVLEAMAGGVAVIASDAGGTREILSSPDVGRLYRCGDLPTLSAHLRELLADPPLRERLGRQAVAHMSARFSIPVMVASIRAAMQSVHAARQALSARPERRTPGAPWTVRREEDVPEDLFEARNTAGAQSISRSARATVTRILHHGRPCYLKEFKYPARLAWRYAWRTPEALANFRMAQRLELRGAAVVPHLAAAWQPRALSAHSALLTGVIDNTQPLTRLLEDAALFARHRRHAAAAFADWLGHLHSAGVAPHDLKISNILVAGLGTRRPAFILLDLDNARLRRWCAVGDRAAERNLHQCFRSFQPRLNRRTVLRFAAAYRIARGLSGTRLRAMLRVVEVRLHRRGTGFAELA